MVSQDTSLPSGVVSPAVHAPVALGVPLSSCIPHPVLPVSLSAPPIPFVGPVPRYPESFFLLRGNHECASLNRIYGTWLFPTIIFLGVGHVRYIRWTAVENNKGWFARVGAWAWGFVLSAFVVVGHVVLFFVVHSTLSVYNSAAVRSTFFPPNLCSCVASCREEESTALPLFMLESRVMPRRFEELH